VNSKPVRTTDRRASPQHRDPEGSEVTGGSDKMGKPKKFDSDVCNKVYSFLDEFDSYFNKMETEYDISTEHLIVEMLREYLE
jgi:hypothetical protein